MTSVGVRELRDGLSRHLADVKRGETVTITEHGRPIARLVPLDGRSVLENLIATGRVVPAAQPKTASPEPLDFGTTISDLVAEQRR